MANLRVAVGVGRYSLNRGDVILAPLLAPRGPSYY